VKVEEEEEVVVVVVVVVRVWQASVAGADGVGEGKSSKTGRGGAVARQVEEDQAFAGPGGLKTEGPEVCCWGRPVEEAKHVDMCRRALLPDVTF
jgi:hypothetical protein